MVKTRINGQSLKARLDMLHQIFVQDADKKDYVEYYFVVDTENAARNAELDFIQTLDSFNLIGELKNYTGGLEFHILRTNGKLKKVALRCLSNHMFLKNYDCYRRGNKTKVVYDVTNP